MNETEVRYLPSISGVGEYMSDLWKDYEGKDIAWWTDNSIYYYPYVLQSFGAREEREEKFQRSNLEIDDDVFVMGDSGGFQNATRGLDFDPDEVLDWQLRRFGGKNTKPMDAGIILDSPPWQEGENITFGKLKKHARKTKENIEKVVGRLSDTDMNVYGVLHGRGLSQWEEWWDITIEPFDFDGIAWAPRSSDCVELATAICFLRSKNIGNIHLLAYTGLRKQTFINYCKRMNFNFITYDSATFSLLPVKGSMFSRYYTKMSVGNRLSKLGLDNLKVIDLCDCPFCRFARKYDEHYNQLDTIKNTFIKAHNFYHTHKLQEFLYWLADSREAYINFLSQIGMKDIMPSLNFIDECEKNGFTSALNTYSDTKDKNQNTLGDTF